MNTLDEHERDSGEVRPEEVGPEDINPEDAARLDAIELRPGMEPLTADEKEASCGAPAPRDAH